MLTNLSDIERVRLRKALASPCSVWVGVGAHPALAETPWCQGLAPRGAVLCAGCRRKQAQELLARLGTVEAVAHEMRCEVADVNTMLEEARP